MQNEYDPGWLDRYIEREPAFGTPRQVLEAFREARRAANSPCARTQ